MSSERTPYNYKSKVYHNFITKYKQWRKLINKNVSIFQQISKYSLCFFFPKFTPFLREEAEKNPHRIYTSPKMIYDAISPTRYQNTRGRKLSIWWNTRKSFSRKEFEKKKKLLRDDFFMSDWLPLGSSQLQKDRRCRKRRDIQLNSKKRGYSTPPGLLLFSFLQKCLLNLKRCG